MKNWTLKEITDEQGLRNWFWFDEAGQCRGEVDITALLEKWTAR